MNQIIHLKEVSSTNDYVKDLVKTGLVQEGLTVWTDFQTAGRGQLGNKWHSTLGENLTFSLLLCPHSLDASQLFSISQIASIAVVNALKHFNIEASIKWPNDIYVGNKKIAGILIENSLSGHSIVNSIIGIGLNVNQKEFDSAIPNPISIFQLTNQTFSREDILKKILSEFTPLYDKIMERKYSVIKNLYFDNLFHKSGYHKYKIPNGKIFEAEIKNIMQAGTLVLSLKEKKEEIKFNFKEVEFIL